ncbi:MAG: hypothetical protein JXR97_00250 [Planctomycetes bacterium]|nr:hypothetical protein [Planctomycetota bacterium]
MSKRAFWGVLIIAVIGIIVVDHFAWSASGLIGRIGSFGGMASPLDEMVSSVTGQTVKRLELEEKLKQATTDKQAAEIAMKLGEIYTKAKEEDLYAKLQETLISRFPKSEIKTIKDATVKLADYYSGKQIKDKLKPILEELFATASAATDIEMLRKISVWAKNGGLEDDFVKYGEHTITVSASNPEVTLSLAKMLLEHYEARKDQENITRIDGVIETAKKSSSKEKIVTFNCKTAQQSINDGKLDEASKALTETLSEYPEFREKVYNSVLMLIEKAVKSGYTDQAVKGWNLVTEYPPLKKIDSTIANKTYGIFLLTVNKLIQVKQKEMLTPVRKSAALLNKNTSLLDSYLDGEKWVDEGRKGKCPKNIYTIKYLPNAEITIDGVLDDKLYASLTPLPAPWFLSHDEEKGTVSHDAGKLALTAYMFYTDEYLYVSVICPEPHPEKINLNLKAGDDPSAWMDDCLEIFIDPARDMGFYQQWVVSCGNARHYYELSGSVDFADKNKDPITSKTMINSDSWSAEIRIPVGMIGVKGGLRGKLVNGNIRRHRWITERMRDDKDVQQDARRSSISWCPKTSNAHNHETFNFFEFE